MFLVDFRISTSFSIPHRCTVVGNPRVGVLGVLAILFLGGYLGLSENLGGSTPNPVRIYGIPTVFL